MKITKLLLGIGMSLLFSSCELILPADGFACECAFSNRKGSNITHELDAETKRDAKKECEHWARSMNASNSKVDGCYVVNN